MNTGNNKSVLRPWRCAGWLLVIAGFWSASTCAIQAQTEEGIKAAFIYNFAKFVEWPATAFATPTAPVTIGFIGGSALADVFEENAKGKNANGRDFVIKRLTNASGAEQCQIVYVADASQLGALSGALKGKPVLLVGEPENILESGGAIRFIKEGAKVVFDLNLASAGAAGLKVDPKIQKAARTVKGG